MLALAYIQDQQAGERTRADVYQAQGFMAALEGRAEEVLTSMTRSIDKGHGEAWDWIHPVLDFMKNNLEYQARLQSLRELKESECTQILEMLCGPNNILNTWQAAVETCQM